MSDPDRETRDARSLFSKVGVSECVWSSRLIQPEKFDVDHVIPFSLWRNNDLWNLLPTHPAVNNQKRDKLPTQPLLHRRRDAVIGYWEALREEHMERFDREAAALCGLTKFPRNDWKDKLFSRLTEAVEITAIQRCIPRWEPDMRAPRSQTVTVLPRPIRASTASRICSSAASQPTTATQPPPREKPTVLCLYDFREVQNKAFDDYLPVIDSFS